MKKLLSILLVLVLCLTIISPSVASAAIKINKSKLTLDAGDTYTLKVSGTAGTIKWTSSEKSVATVSSKGKVTAISGGITTITATVKAKKYKCSVTVKESETKTLGDLVDYLKSFDLLKGEESMMAASMIGGVRGVRYSSVEIYEFDMDSDSYKALVKSNKISFVDFDMDFAVDGINKNFVILCGGATNTKQILEKFNSFK